MSTEITKKDKIFFILKNIGIGLYIVLLVMFFMKSPLVQLLHSNFKKTRTLLPLKKVATTYRELFVLLLFYVIITIFTIQLILEENNWKRTIYIVLECFMTVFLIALFVRTSYETRFLKKTLQKKKWFKQFQNIMIKK